MKSIEAPEEIKAIIKTIEGKSFNKRNIYKIIRDKRGYRMAEHLIIWEEKYGKKPVGSVIHHINGDKLDNRIENLMLFPSNTAHMNYHKQLKKLFRERNISL